MRPNAESKSSKLAAMAGVRANVEGSTYSEALSEVARANPDLARRARAIGVES